jgi:tetratricopeptide (TPR) repeat protein
MEAMQRLREQYLNIALEGVLHPPTPEARQASKSQQVAADTAPQVMKKELTAQQWFERAFDTKDLDEKIRFYSQAIQLKPDYALAFYNRGVTRGKQGDLDGALADYNEAIRIKPDYPSALNNRGLARADQGDLDGAIADYNQAIRLKPDYAVAFNSRAVARKDKGDLYGALADYNEAIRLEPDYADAYYNRALLFRQKAEHEAAISNFQKYLDLGGGTRDGDQAAIEQKILDLKKRIEKSKRKT